MEMWIRIVADKSLDEAMRSQIEETCRNDALEEVGKCYAFQPLGLPSSTELMTLTFMTISSLTALLKVWLSGKRRRIIIKRGDTSVEFDGPDFEGEADAVAKVLSNLNREKGVAKIVAKDNAHLQEMPKKKSRRTTKKTNSG